MNDYSHFNSVETHILKELNDKVIEEEKKDNPDNKKILKLKQQILMKGIEISSGFSINNYNKHF